MSLTIFKKNNEIIWNICLLWELLIKIKCHHCVNRSLAFSLIYRTIVIAQAVTTMAYVISVIYAFLFD